MKISSGRRDGADKPPAPAATHPEVNLGTRTMNRTYWAEVVDTFLSALLSYDFLGRSLDVRENVKFGGGWFGRWIHETFPRSGCCLSIEFKKTFMDEWSGAPDFPMIQEIENSLRAATEPLLKTLPGKYTRKRTASPPVPQETIDHVCQRLRHNKRVRRSLPSGGRLHIDRRLPFLCMSHLSPHNKTTGTSRLIRGEAAYLITACHASLRSGIRRLLEAIIDLLSEKFGAFLLIEIRAADPGRRPAQSPDDPGTFQPGFQIIAPHAEKEHGGHIVLKPLQGSGGQGVFLVQPDDKSNLNQMIESISRDGYVIAQEYLPAAEKGDIRLFMMNGLPLRYRGKYAAFRRIRSADDMRSNIHAGGKKAQAEINSTHLELAKMVRPKLVQDGMFLVGLDIVGDKLMEINVFSPGGLGSAR